MPRFLLLALPLLLGATAPSALANIKDAKGKVIGTARFEQALDGLSLIVTIRKAKRLVGTRAVHLHEVGNCSGNGFTAAAGHWNPTGKEHGRDNKLGAHAGDLPNIIIDKKGNGTLSAVIPVGRLTGGKGGLLDSDGAAIVLHASADDQMSAPEGNSGTRIACGIITP